MISEKALRIAELFQRRSIHFLHHQMSDAKVEADAQLARWNELLRRLQAEIPTKYMHLTKLFPAFSEYISRSKGEIFRITRAIDGGFDLVGSIPLIDDRLASLDSTHATTLGLAVYFEVINIVPEPQFDPPVQEVPFSLLKALVDYGAANYFTGGDLKRYFSDKAAEFDESIIMWRELHSEMKREQEGRNRAASDFARDLEEKLAGSKLEIAAIKAAAIESQTYKTAAEFWSKKISDHARSFWFWIIAFLSFCGALAWFYDSHIGTWKNSFSVLFGNSNANYSSVLIFAAPIAGAAWVLRILSKLAFSARSLYEDAQHRHNLIATFLHLVSDSNAKMTENDRSVFLAAIFRPLGPASNDEHFPPSLIDVLRPGQK